MKTFAVLSDCGNVARALALYCALIPHQSPAGATDIHAGSYAIESKMVLPHLDEMRRTSEHRIVCIDDADPARLFPVFQQPAFIGCTLDRVQVEVEALHYRLVCNAINGATGSVHLKREGNKLRGELRAKMGGKNMTFSQYIKAVYEGACAVP